MFHTCAVGPVLSTGHQRITSIDGDGLAVEKVVAGDKEDGAGHIAVVTWPSGGRLALMLLLGNAEDRLVKPDLPRKWSTH